LKSLKTIHDWSSCEYTRSLIKKECF